VLACAKVTVRVINSSGFKIPGFSIQVLLSEYEYPVANVQLNHHSVAANVLPNKSIQRVEGVDYFLAGAIADRQFNFSIFDFCSMFVVVRIIYSDVITDGDIADFFVLPVIDTPTQEATGNADLDNLPSVDTKLKRNISGAGTESATHSCVVDCSPLLIPSSGLLVAYGCGSLSAMLPTYSISHDFHGGIPKSVFQSLWSRTPSGKVISIASAGIDNSVCNISDEVTTAVLARDSLGQKPLGSIGMDARVRLTELNGNTSASSLQKLSSTLAWCFHDWWGSEVCLVMRLSKLCLGNTQSNTKHAIWSGEMELRSSNALLIETLVQDAYSLMLNLTCGIVMPSHHRYRSTNTAPTDFDNRASSLEFLHLPLSLQRYVCAIDKDISDSNNLSVTSDKIIRGNAMFAAISTAAVQTSSTNGTVSLL
jgi:hypothetical protein